MKEKTQIFILQPMNIIHHGWRPVYFFPNIVEKKQRPIDLIDIVTLTTKYTITKLAFDFQ